MNITYTSDGYLKIHVGSLLERVSDEDKLALVDTLACEDVVIAYVTQQILDGWTEQASHGARAITADAEPRRGLDKAVREVARRAGEIAAKEIERLEDALKQAEERIHKLEDEHRDAAAEARWNGR